MRPLATFIWLPMIRFASFPFVIAATVGLATVTGCGIPEKAQGIFDPDLGESPVGVDADLLVGGRLTVGVTGSSPARFRVEALLPEDLPMTVGKVLVVALRDVSQPWLRCEGAATDSNCTVLVSEENATPPSVALKAENRDLTLFLESTFELGEAPGPGCSAFLIGGTPVQWHVVLGENFIPASTVIIDLKMRKTHVPETVFGWQLLLTDPPSEPPSEQTAIGCV